MYDYSKKALKQIVVVHIVVSITRGLPIFPRKVLLKRVWDESCKSIKVYK